MNYADQRIYLKQSRARAIVLVLLWLAIASVSTLVSHASGQSAGVSACVVAAVAVSLLYTPDYLHLTVNPRKRIRWQIMIRWRIVAAVLILGLLFSFLLKNPKDAIAVLIAAAWLAAVNFLAGKSPATRYIAPYFWVTDLALIAAVLFMSFCSPLLGAALLAAAAHLSIVISERRPIPWAGIVAASAGSLLLAASLKLGLGRDFLLLALPMVLLSAGATAWLVHCAQVHNATNTRAALRELADFAGYSAERIFRMWSESDKELARNWIAAALDETDSQALAEWYRQNSELYMFAISGYNLDYKRIRSNLKVLRFARGACLDYGAGNGEIILELARGGHSATYYDVDGVSARFAKHRALKQGLDVKFAPAKEQLNAGSGQNGFDTVFSLDVLEHLPDLPGELTFLASLLNLGGRLVFDVPAVSTKSHPMHLNHTVDLHNLLASKGLREQRSWWQRLLTVKQEKYVFERLPELAGSLPARGIKIEN